ncbi:MAG TPA: hypothetical protein VH083_12070 [Myxococcales bacterium]|nr:hypothetical protein [Myxococcales bacterium]
MRWYFWREQLEKKASRALPEVAAPGSLSPKQAASILRSLRKFQLGESGEGRVAHEIDEMPWADGDLRALIKLWVREEGRHARILARMVQDQGGTLLRKDWSARGFEVARRLLGVRFKLLVALAAEVAGTVFYGLLGRALRPCPLSAALLEMEADEELHLAFQAELFGMFGTSRARYLLIQTAWICLGLGVSLLVLWDHAPTLESVGVPRRQTFRELMRGVFDVRGRIRAHSSRGLRSPSRRRSVLAK